MTTDDVYENLSAGNKALVDEAEALALELHPDLMYVMRGIPLSVAGLARATFVQGYVYGAYRG